MALGSSANARKEYVIRSIRPPGRCGVERVGPGIGRASCFWRQRHRRFSTFRSLALQISAASRLLRRHVTMWVGCAARAHPLGAIDASQRPNGRFTAPLRPSRHPGLTELLIAPRVGWTALGTLCSGIGHTIRPPCPLLQESSSQVTRRDRWQRRLFRCPWRRRPISPPPRAATRPRRSPLRATATATSHQAEPTLRTSRVQWPRCWAWRPGRLHQTTNRAMTSSSRPRPSATRPSTSGSVQPPTVARRPTILRTSCTHPSSVITWWTTTRPATPPRSACERPRTVRSLPRASSPPVQTS